MLWNLSLGSLEFNFEHQRCYYPYVMYLFAFPSRLARTSLHQLELSSACHFLKTTDSADILHVVEEPQIAVELSKANSFHRLQS